MVNETLHAAPLRPAVFAVPGSTRDRVVDKSVSTEPDSVASSCFVVWWCWVASEVARHVDDQAPLDQSLLDPICPQLFYASDLSPSTGGPVIFGFPVVWLRWCLTGGDLRRRSRSRGKHVPCDQPASGQHDAEIQNCPSHTNSTSAQASRFD